LQVKNKKIVALVAVLAFILIGAVVADLLLTKQIPTSMIIKPTLSMDIFDVDGVTPLTSIALGQFSWHTDETFFPGHLTSAPSEYYYIKNTDQTSFYIAFEVAADYPSLTIGFVFYAKRGDQAAFTTLISGIYNLPIETSLVNPDPATQYAVWYFKVWIAEPPFGSYNPTILVHAYDTASG